MKEFLKDALKDDKGQPSWLRVACSIIIITGCLSIFIQLLMCGFNTELYKNIEWMQPITLIGIGLTGKVAQKQIEKTNS
jgi:Na+-translocating ferredoxin:NAD+ oxidoreductase RnfE subunit